MLFHRKPMKPPTNILVLSKTVRIWSTVSLPWVVQHTQLTSLCCFSVCVVRVFVLLFCMCWYVFCCWWYVFVVGVVGVFVVLFCMCWYVFCCWYVFVVRVLVLLICLCCVCVHLKVRMNYFTRTRFFKLSFFSEHKVSQNMSKKINQYPTNFNSPVVFGHPDR